MAQNFPPAGGGGQQWGVDVPGAGGIPGFPTFQSAVQVDAERLERQERISPYVSAIK